MQIRIHNRSWQISYQNHVIFEICSMLKVIKYLHKIKEHTIISYYSSTNCEQNLYLTYITLQITLLL